MTSTTTAQAELDSLMAVETLTSEQIYRITQLTRILAIDPGYTRKGAAAELDTLWKLDTPSRDQIYRIHQLMEMIATDHR